MSWAAEDKKRVLTENPVCGNRCAVVCDVSLGEGDVQVEREFDPCVAVFASFVRCRSTAVRRCCGKRKQTVSLPPFRKVYLILKSLWQPMEHEQTGLSSCLRSRMVRGGSTDGSNECVIKHCNLEHVIWVNSYLLE